LRYIAKQNLAFRGTNDKINVDNNGKHFVSCWDDCWMASYHLSHKIKEVKEIILKVMKLKMQ